MSIDGKERRWWQLELSQRSPRTSPVLQGVTIRPIELDDAEALAQLMLDAYAGTIDSEGETIVEARDEIGGWFERDWPNAVCAAASFVAVGSVASQTEPAPSVP